MTRGGVIALGAATAGAVLLVAIVVGVAVHSCSKAPETTGPGAPSPGMVAANEGMNAKGTAELRRLGCSEALVVDMARVLGDPARIREGEPRFMVTCDVPASADAPSCEKLASVYYAAVGSAEGDVCVRVSRVGSTAYVCSHLYAPNGADLGPFPRVP
jgi:hypothetical protein